MIFLSPEGHGHRRSLLVRHDDDCDDALQWGRGPFLFVPSAFGPRQSAPPGAERRAPEGSSLALAQFPPSHVGRESPQSLSARHGDDDGCSRPLEHAQSLLVSSGLALQLYARPVGSGRVRSVRSGQVGSGRVRSGQVGSGQVHSSIVADNKPEHFSNRHHCIYIYTFCCIFLFCPFFFFT